MVDKLKSPSRKVTKSMLMKVYCSVKCKRVKGVVTDLIDTMDTLRTPVMVLDSNTAALLEPHIEQSTTTKE